MYIHTYILTQAAPGGATSSCKSEILYMSAVLGRRTGSAAPEESLALLNEAVEAHFRSVRGLAFGAEYLTVMNPDYVTTLVREYLLHAPTEPAGKAGGSGSQVSGYTGNGKIANVGADFFFLYRPGPPRC